MGRDQLDQQAQETLALANFAKVVAACGTSRFHHELSVAINALVPSDTAGVMQLSEYSVPQYLLTRNIPEDECAFYLSGFYRMDPFFRYWRMEGRPGVTSLDRLADKVDRSSYMTSFQPRTGMMDELGILLSKFPGVADDFFFLRKHPFTEAELVRLDAAFPLIEQLHRMNTRLGLQALAMKADASGTAGDAECFAVLDQGGQTVFASPDWSALVGGDLALSDAVAQLSRQDEPGALPFSRGYVASHRFEDDFALSPSGKLILVFLADAPRQLLRLDEVLDNLFADQLTNREMGICQLILQGHPTASIATQLNISPGTVKNHRKRIYRKLDITSERELFLSVVSWFSRPEG